MLQLSVFSPVLSVTSGSGSVVGVGLAVTLVTLQSLLTLPGPPHRAAAVTAEESVVTSQCSDVTQWRYNTAFLPSWHPLNPSHTTSETNTEVIIIILATFVTVINIQLDMSKVVACYDFGGTTNRNDFWLSRLRLSFEVYADCCTLNRDERYRSSFWGHLSTLSMRKLSSLTLLKLLIFEIPRCIKSQRWSLSIDYATETEFPDCWQYSMRFLSI